LALSLDVLEGSQAMINIFGMNVDETVDVHKLVVTVEAGISVVGFVMGVFLAIFATANLMPTMLEKGSIELLISKPLTRNQLLLGRYVGALSIMILNVVYLIGGNWLIFSIKSGFWHFAYLSTIPLIIIAFALMYTLMTFVAVTTRSTGVTMMVAYMALLFSPMLAEKDRVYALLTSKFYDHLLAGLYHALPKTYDLILLNMAIVREQSVTNWSALWSSCLAGVLTLALAMYVFARKDF
jgi:ABC-type transport system involved in multi-copper enzyme maturation permease subunit